MGDTVVSKTKSGNICSISHISDDGSINFVITFPKGIALDNKDLKERIEIFDTILQFNKDQVKQLTYFLFYILDKEWLK